MKIGVKHTVWRKSYTGNENPREVLKPEGEPSNKKTNWVFFIDWYNFNMKLLLSVFHCVIIFQKMKIGVNHRLWWKSYTGTENTQN
jgi:hypothetical protein